MNVFPYSVCSGSEYEFPVVEKFSKDSPQISKFKSECTVIY